MGVQRFCNSSTIMEYTCSISCRYSSVFSSLMFPAGTSIINEGAYNGNAVWSGICVSDETGFFLFKASYLVRTAMTNDD